MITFIIPSIGKPTLQRAINSIKNQTSDDWKAIIIFDGIEPTISIDNDKFSVLKIEKRGVGGNGAGNVRNHGMKFVETEWIAFLDDDDTIASDYVETFKKDLLVESSADVIIFRMYRPNLNPVILPQLETDNFYQNEVGISFALRTEIFKKGHSFVPSAVEDYNYLNDLRDNKYCIMISPHVKYFVNGNVDVDVVSQKGNRVIINSKKEGFGQMANTSHWYLPFLFLVLLALSFLIIRKVNKYKIYFGVIVLACIIVFALQYEKMFIFIKL
jgi:glycosyltransferase involved in cell wall biosynthesis